MPNKHLSAEQVFEFPNAKTHFLHFTRTVLLNKQEGRSIKRIMFVGDYFVKEFLSPFLTGDNIALNNLFYDTLEVVLSRNVDTNKANIAFDAHILELGFIKQENSEQKNAIWTKTLTSSHRERSIQVNLSVEPIDLENPVFWEEPIYPEEQLFDIIICPFTFTYRLNWRFSLFSLMQMLKPAGHLLLSEARGDFDFFDGNFRHTAGKPASDHSENTHKLIESLEKFDKIRKRHYYWSPEVSVSNIQAIRRQIQGLFDEVLESEWPAEEHNVYVDEIIQQWIRRASPTALSYFNIGIPQNNLEELVQDAQLLAVHEPVVVSKQLKVYWFRRLNKKSYDNFSAWDFSNLNSALNRVHAKSYNRLCSQSMDLLVSHDIMLPHKTYYCGLIAWKDGAKSFEHDDPVYLLLNTHVQNLEADSKPEKLLSQFTSLLANKRLGVSVIDWLLRRLPVKCALSFQLSDMPQALSKNRKKILFVRIKEGERPGKADDKVYFEIVQDSKKQARKIFITLPSFFRRDITNTFVKTDSKEAQITSKNDFGVPEKVAELMKEPQSIPAIKGMYKLSLDRNFLDDCSKEFEFETNFDKQNFEQDCYEASDKDLRDIFNLSDKESIRRLVVAFYEIASLHLDSTSKVLTLLPADLFHQGEDEDKQSFDRSLDYYPKGPGGLVLLEEDFRKRVNPAKPNKLYGLVEKRDQAIAEVCNEVFRKLGYAGYLERAFLIRDAKASIAAVISRNGAHGIGSHVLPGLQNTAFLNSEARLLMQYLEQRLDFIAQVASEVPQWSLPVWFASDLMMRFYSQKLLLSNIAKAEQLHAYEYQGIAGIDSPIFDDLQANLIDANYIADAGNIVLHGYLSRIEGSNIFLIGKPQKKHAPPSPEIKCCFPEQADQDRLHHLKPGCELRISGLLERPITTTEMDAGICLSGCRLIENKIIIKVRRKLYAGRAQLQSMTKEVLGENGLKLHSQYFANCVDVGKLQEVINHWTQGAYNEHYYGTIHKLDALGPEEAQLQLLCSTPFLCRFTHSEEIKILLEHFNVGDRIVLSGVPQPTATIPPASFLLTNCKVLEKAVVKNLAGISESKDRLSLDEQVALPGGLMGAQAFFSLLENIIRNTAKHNWIHIPAEKRTGANLELKIEIEDGGNDRDYIVCRVWSNASNLFYPEGIESAHTKPFEIEEILHRHYNYDDIESYSGQEQIDVPQQHSTATDNTLLRNASKEEPLTKKLNKILFESFTDINGQLKRHALGLAELKISAGILAQAEIIDIAGLSEDQIIFNKRNGSGFLRATSVWEAERNTENEDVLVPRLGYMFKLLKPKELIVISNRSALNDKDEKNSLPLGFSIKLLKHAEAFTRGNSLDYEFCVICDDSDLPREGRYQYTEHFIKDIKAYYHALLNAKDESDFGLSTEAVLSRLLGAIEVFPYRLFIATDDDLCQALHLHLNGTKQENHNRIFPNEWQYKKWLFFNKRIIFIKKTDFWNELRYPKQNNPETSQAEPGLVMKLYFTWVRKLYKIHRHFHHSLKVNLSPTSKSSEKQVIFAPPYFVFDLFRAQITAEILSNCNCNTHDSAVIKDFFEKRVRIFPEKMHDTDAFYYEIKLQVKKHLGAYQHCLTLEHIVKAMQKYQGIADMVLLKQDYVVPTLPIVYSPSDGKKATKQLNTRPFRDNTWLQYIPEGFLPNGQTYNQETPERWIEYARHEPGKGEHLYAEALSGSQYFFSVLKECPDDPELVRKIVCQLYENAAPAVLIIDERIIQFALEHENMYERYFKMNLLVPHRIESPQLTRDFGNPIHKFGEECTIENSEGIKIVFRLPQNLIPESQKNIEHAHKWRSLVTVVLIHQTVLQSLCGKDKAKMDAFIKFLKVDCGIPAVIVISGRGTPYDLPEQAKFVGYANIENFLTQPYPEKILMMQALFKSIKGLQAYPSVEPPKAH